MLVLFFELIQRVDPEFISGFNDSCFDLPYIKDKITIFDNLQFCMG